MMKNEIKITEKYCSHFIDIVLVCEREALKRKANRKHETK